MQLKGRHCGLKWRNIPILHILTDEETNCYTAFTHFYVQPVWIPLIRILHGQ